MTQENQEDKDRDLRMIVRAIMKTYQNEMHNYLSSNENVSLLESDVIIMIMTLVVSVSTNIYYTLKQILPNTIMDYDFMKAKMGNAIFDEFEKIKQYKPEDSMLALTTDQVSEIKEKGFIIIETSPGESRRITLDDILIDRKSAEKLLHEAKENTKKIITPYN